MEEIEVYKILEEIRRGDRSCGFWQMDDLPVRLVFLDFTISVENLREKEPTISVDIEKRTGEPGYLVMAQVKEENNGDKWKTKVFVFERTPTEASQDDRERRVVGCIQRIRSFLERKLHKQRDE